MANERGLTLVKDNPLTDSAAAVKFVVPAARASLANNPAAAWTSTTTTKRASLNQNKSSFVYKHSSLASIKVEEDCCYMMGTWVMEKMLMGMWMMGKTLPAMVNIRAKKQRGLSVS
jgi:hypothetical protein